MPATTATRVIDATAVRRRHVATTRAHKLAQRSLEVQAGTMARLLDEDGHPARMDLSGIGLTSLPPGGVTLDPSRLDPSAVDWSALHAEARATLRRDRMHSV